MESLLASVDGLLPALTLAAALGSGLMAGVFLGVFMGTAAACVLLIVASPYRWQEPDAVYALVGAAFYFVGTFLVTLIFNVPMNKVLAPLRRGDPRAAVYWPRSRRRRC